MNKLVKTPSLKITSSILSLIGSGGTSSGELNFSSTFFISARNLDVLVDQSKNILQKSKKILISCDLHIREYVYMIDVIGFQYWLLIFILFIFDRQR